MVRLEEGEPEAKVEERPEVMVAAEAVLVVALVEEVTVAVAAVAVVREEEELDLGATGELEAEQPE